MQSVCFAVKKRLEQVWEPTPLFLSLALPCSCLLSSCVSFSLFSLSRDPSPSLSLSKSLFRFHSPSVSVALAPSRALFRSLSLSLSLFLSLSPPLFSASRSLSRFAGKKRLEEVLLEPKRMRPRVLSGASQGNFSISFE